MFYIYKLKEINIYNDIIIYQLIVLFFSLQNGAPTGEAYTSQNQSVAAYVAADKIAFYHCAFFSTHNTLFDSKGRHYYANCYIQGSIDFIFGRSRTIFYVIKLPMFFFQSILSLTLVIE